MEPLWVKSILRQKFCRQPPLKFSVSTQSESQKLLISKVADHSECRQRCANGIWWYIFVHLFDCTYLISQSQLQNYNTKGANSHPDTVPKTVATSSHRTAVALGHPRSSWPLARVAAMNISQPVGSSVESVEFTFLSTEEIRASSVRRIENDSTFDTLLNPVPGGLYDPALGSWGDSL